MIRSTIIALLFLLPMAAFSQADTTKLLRAFPITDYMMKFGDTVTLVQIQVPNTTIIKEKQIGLLYALRGKDRTEANELGYGRCNLIKGDYYYFTLDTRKSATKPAAGDLLYVLLSKTNAYHGQVLPIAAHMITLLNVYDEPMYDKYEVFNKWTRSNEEALLDSARSDIRFTGKYFSDNNPSMDIEIKDGMYKSKKVFAVMMNVEKEDIRQFFAYLVARPKLYAGHNWKVSEVFATWASEGAPTVK